MSGTMEILNHIVEYPNPILTTVCERVDPYKHGYDFLMELRDALRDVCNRNDGLGLSAPQLGVPIRMFYVAPIETFFYNPRVFAEVGQEPMDMFSIEGCFSLPGQTFYVRGRYDRIFAQYDEAVCDLEYGADPVVGEFDGQTAIIIQHEMDHLNGLLINRFNIAGG